MPPGESPPTATIWRIRDRATFRALRSAGRRARSGPLTVVHLPDPDRRPPGVAFAVGRRVGPAVTRNRLRRRLRAAMRAVGPGPGSYLVTVSPEAATLSFEELRRCLAEATAKATRG